MSFHLSLQTLSGFLIPLELVHSARSGSAYSPAYITCQLNSSSNGPSASSSSSSVLDCLVIPIPPSSLAFQSFLDLSIRELKRRLPLGPVNLALKGNICRDSQTLRELNVQENDTFIVYRAGSHDRDCGYMDSSALWSMLETVKLFNALQPTFQRECFRMLEYFYGIKRVRSISDPIAKDYVERFVEQEAKSFIKASQGENDMKYFTTQLTKLGKENSSKDLESLLRSMKELKSHLLRDDSDSDGEHDSAGPAKAQQEKEKEKNGEAENDKDKGKKRKSPRKQEGDGIKVKRERVEADEKEREVKSAEESARANSAAAAAADSESRTGRSADPAKVEILRALGFTSSQCERALVFSNNNLDVASNILTESGGMSDLWRFSPMMFDFPSDRRSISLRVARRPPVEVDDIFPSSRRSRD